MTAQARQPARSHVSRVLVSIAVWVAAAAMPAEASSAGSAAAGFCVG